MAHNTTILFSCFMHFHIPVNGFSVNIAHHVSVEFN